MTAKEFIINRYFNDRNASIPHDINIDTSLTLHINDIAQLMNDYLVFSPSTLDNVTAIELQTALTACGVNLNANTIDTIVDVIELMSRKR